MTVLISNMHRFFVTQVPDGETVVLSAREQLHHLKNVLRLTVGDEITVCDANGTEYLCLVTRLESEKALLTVRAKALRQSRPVKLTVACAIPKKGKLDDIVDKLTQLGAHSIIPMETARVIVKLTPGDKDARLARWRRLAQAAAEQSQRSTIPEIAPPTPMKKVLSESAQYDMKIIPTLSGDRKPLSSVLAGHVATNILALIGPEGDFTAEEIELAIQAGFIPVSLGSRVLRVETAAVALTSYIALSHGL